MINREFKKKLEKLKIVMKQILKARTMKDLDRTKDDLDKVINESDN